MAVDELRGERVRLRAFEPDDWALFAHRHDTEFDRLYGATRLPISRAIAVSRAEAAGRASVDDLVDLVVETNEGVAIGTASTVRVDRRNRVFVAAGWLKREYWRQGFGTEAGRLFLGFYFHELGYQKAEAEVHEYNHVSLAWVESLGFVPEGRRRRSTFTGGRYHDELLFGMTVEEFDAGIGRQR